MEVSGVRTGGGGEQVSGWMEVSGVGFQVSGGKAVTTKNYMDVEDRGQNLEVGREGFSCGSGFQPRSYDLNEFNDLPLTGIWMQDEVSASMFFFLTPDT